MSNMLTSIFFVIYYFYRANLEWFDKYSIAFCKTKLSTQRGFSCEWYNVVKDVFSWSAFENSLDKDLFYDVYRMNKTSFNKLLKHISPQLREKYKDPKKLCLSYACQLSITLSYLGCARICDLRVLHRTMKRKVFFLTH